MPSDDEFGSEFDRIAAEIFDNWRGFEEDDVFTLDPLAGADWGHVDPPSDQFPVFESTSYTNDPSPFQIWPSETIAPDADGHWVYRSPYHDDGDTYRVGPNSEPLILPYAFPNSPTDVGARCVPRAFIDEVGTVRQCVYSNGLCRFFCKGKIDGDCSEIEEATKQVQDVLAEANQRLIHGPHPAAKAPDTNKRNIIRPSEAPSPIKDKETKGAAKKRGR
jgi:hypothetical protein